MSNAHQHSNPSEASNPEHFTFDVAAADRERLSWRVGGEEPTERALGRDEVLAREHAKERDDVSAERAAARARLDESLGSIASKDLRPDDN